MFLFIHYYFQTYLQIICSWRISAIPCHGKNWVLVRAWFGKGLEGRSSLWILERLALLSHVRGIMKRWSFCCLQQLNFALILSFALGKWRKFAFQGQTLCSFNQQLSLWIPDILDPSSFCQTEIPMIWHDLSWVISDTRASLSIPEHSQVFPSRMAFPSDPAANEGVMAYYGMGTWCSSCTPRTIRQEAAQSPGFAQQFANLLAVLL